MSMDDFALIYTLLAVLFAIALLPFICAVHSVQRRLGFDLFEPVYGATLYFVFIFGIRSLYALHVGTLFLGDPPFDSETRQAWVMSLIYLILALITFLTAYYSGLGPALARSLPRLPTQWAPSRIPIVVCGLTIVGLGAFALLVQYFGGFESYLTQKQLTLTAGGTTYLYQLMTSLWFAGVVAYIAHLRFRWSRVFVALPLLLAVGVGATTGSKGLVVFPVLSLAVVYHYLHKRLPAWTVLVAGAVIVPIIPVFNIYRHTPDIGDIIPRSIEVLVNPGLLLAHVLSRFHDIDAFITVIRDTPRVMDFQLGATLLPLVTVWIPRVIWPDKPVVSFSKVFGETYWSEFFGGTGTAPSVTVLGEGYVNFHVVGVLWVAAVSGVTVRAIYWYLVKRGGYPGIMVYSVIYFPYLVMFWEAGIAGLLPRAAFTIGSAVLASALLGGRASAGWLARAATNRGVITSGVPAAPHYHRQA